MKSPIIAFILLSLITARTFASIGEPISYWKKNEVRVCWQNKETLSKELFTENQWKKLSAASQELKEMSLEQKQLIKDSIQNEYNLSQTGISFIGWNSCKEDPNADAILIVVNSDEQPLGRASVGRSEIYVNEISYDLETFPLPHDAKTFVLLNLMKAYDSVVGHEDELKYSAIHEFGHLAGLRHENISPDAEKDPNCTEYDIGSEIAMDKIKPLTPYDPSSIMNYCLYSFIRKSGLDFRVDDFGNVINDFNALIFSFEKLAVYDDELIFRKVGGFKYQARFGLSKNDIEGLKCIYLNQGCE
jgi:hypothetical protein